MTAAEVVARFSGAKRSGEGWTARCPAHEDRRASLSITEKPDRTLLHCHAGCDPDAVADAAGLSLADLFADVPPRSGMVKPSLTATYDYTDERGALLYQSIRYVPKDFRQRRPDGNGGWTWKLGEVPRVPYRLPEVLAAIKAGRLVFIVEGEKDADRLAGFGFAATCNAGGASKSPDPAKCKWNAELSEHFHGARVAILPDNDEPGRVHARGVANRLDPIASEVRIVELPRLAPKGDVSDWLDGGGTVEQLKDLVRSAPVWTPEAAGTPESAGATRPRIRTLQSVLDDPEAMKEPQAVLPRLAYEGRLTLLSAREKEGKSTLASAGAAAVSDGARFLGEMGKAGTVLWVGLEEHPGDTARRFQGFGAQGDQVFLLEMLEDPFADLAAAVEQSGAVLVVVDTLARFAETLVKDASKSTEWTPVMAGLARVARATGAAVLLLHHARKDGGYRDSTAIGAGVDAIFEMTAGDDGTTRRIKGRGRWAIEDFAIRLEGNRYMLAAGELTLDARVLLFTESNPGCSMRALRNGITGKTETITAAVSNLLATGAIEDRGDDSGRQLYPKGWEPPPDPRSDRAGSRENPQGTAPEPLPGTTSEGERFPVPAPREAEREPRPAAEAEVVEL